MSAKVKQICQIKTSNFNLQKSNLTQQFNIGNKYQACPDFRRNELKTDGID